MSKSFRDDYYAEDNFKPKKNKKLSNKQKRTGTKNFLRNIDINNLDEDYDYEEDDDNS